MKLCGMISAFLCFALNPIASAAGTNNWPTGHWPGWRGADRSNRSTETGLLRKWPAGGPPLVWIAQGLGHGIASVSVAGGSVYTIGYAEDREFIYALHADTGESRWCTSVGAAAKEDSLMRWLSQRSPTIDEDRLYTTTVHGELFCLRTRDGAVVWQKSYPKDFGSPRPRWGFGDRPLVDGEKLICAPAGTNGAIVALNKQTGALIWRTMLDKKEMEGYAPPILSLAGGVRQYIVTLRVAIYGVAADDGRVLWSTTNAIGSFANSYTPINYESSVFCLNGYRGGMALVMITNRGEGFRAEAKYHHLTPFSPFQDSSVLVGKHVYTFQAVGMPICINVESGETAWGPILPGKDRAALTYAEEHIYARRAGGQMVLYKADPREYHEVSSFEIRDREEAAGATAPVIAGQRLYLRDNRRLLCYDIRQAGAGKPARETKIINVSLADAQNAATNASPQTSVTDAIFVPTPHDVVSRMLELANTSSTDTVYDLGSGDGRILIAAAKTHRSKAVGYELDPELARESGEAVRKTGLDSLVTIHQTNMFTADLTGADVVALYLPTELMARLQPQFDKLKPGARIVSHQFRIPGVPPDRTITVISEEDGEPHRIYFWKAPLKSGNQAAEDTSTVNRKNRN